MTVAREHRTGRSAGGKRGGRASAARDVHADALFLQQAMGNRAVAGLISRAPGDVKDAADALREAESVANDLAEEIRGGRATGSGRPARDTRRLKRKLEDIATGRPGVSDADRQKAADLLGQIEDRENELRARRIEAERVKGEKTRDERAKKALEKKDPQYKGDAKKTPAKDPPKGKSTPKVKTPPAKPPVVTKTPPVVKTPPVIKPPMTPKTPPVRTRTPPKPPPPLGSVKTWGRVGPFAAAMLYLDLHAAHFKALAAVKARAEFAQNIVKYIDELEKGARELAKAVHLQRVAEYELPASPLMSEEDAGRAEITPEEIKYTEEYYVAAARISHDAWSARNRLDDTIKGWDGVNAEAQKLRDFTLKAVSEAISKLDWRFNNEGGSFRAYIVDQRDTAWRVASWADAKVAEAKDILDTLERPTPKITY